MKKTIVTIFAVAFLATQAFAAFEIQPSGRALGMAGAFTALADDLNCFLFNPAGLVQNRRIGLLVSYDQRYVGIGQNLGRTLLATGMSMDRFSFGVAWNFESYEVYREMVLAETFAMTVDPFKMISVGVTAKQLNRGYTLDQDMQNDPLFTALTGKWNMSFDAGLLFRPNDTMSIGATAFDFLSPNLAIGKDATDKLPLRVAAGAAMKLKQLTVSADVLWADREINGKADIDGRLGVEYSLKEKIFVRGGYDLMQSALSAGASLQFSMFKFDYAFKFQMAGMGGNFGSHSLAIGMNFGVRSTVPGSISGRIFAAENGAPAAGAMVKAMQGGKLISQTASDGDGSFKLANLLEGHYDIVAAGKGLSERVQEYKEVAAGEDTINVNFRLYEAPASISGKVTGMDGITAVKSAFVKVSKGNLIIGQVVSKDNGEFEVLNIPEGSYTVAVSAKRYGAKTMENVFVNKGDALQGINFALPEAELPKMAVMPFNNATEAAKRDDYGTAVANMLTTAVFKTKKFNVIERENLEKVLKEQTLWMSGVVDEGSSKKIGQLTGVSFLIVGSVSKLGAFIELDARLIDTESGKVIQTASGKATSEELLRGAIDKLVADMMKKF